MTRVLASGRARARAAVALVFTFTLAFAVILFPGAHAEEPPDDPDAVVSAGSDVADYPWARAVELALEATRLESRLADVTNQLDAAQKTVASFEADLKAATQRWVDAVNAVEVTRDRLRRRAAVAYTGQGGTDALLQVDEVESLARAEEYSSAAAGVDDAEFRSLELDAAGRSIAREELVRKETEALVVVQTLTATRDDVAGRATTAQVALQVIGGVSVMGPSYLSAEQLTAWFLSTGAKANLPEGTTIVDLAAMYIEEGAAENVRGDLAFAQSVLETGSFRETRGNNYSGIGNCDSCGGKGMMFPTPRDGVRAQIQLLRNYADPASRAANLRYPADPTLYAADPVKAASEYDTFFLKGKVPLWNQMGNGNWATSTTYASKVLSIYRRMLAFATAPS